MAIEITNAEHQPPLVYDHIFMHSLTIDQRMVKENSVPPNFTLRVEYRMYAVGPDDTRHYKPGMNTILIDDYYTAAMTKAMQGDMDLANAMGAIEHALAKILEDQTDVGSTTVKVN